MHNTLISLNPRLRGGDEAGINQRFLNVLPAKAGIHNLLISLNLAYGRVTKQGLTRGFLLQDNPYGKNIVRLL